MTVEQSDLQRAVLELDVDIDGDGSTETGVFEFVGDLEISQIGDTEPTLGEGDWTGRIATGIDAVATSILGPAQPTRQGFWLDLGVGKHSMEINWTGWEGATDKDGNNVQWGTSSTEGLQTSNGTLVSATGQGPLIQMQLLAEFWRRGEFDSRAADARLRWGEYSDGTYASSAGELDDWLHVTIPRFDFSRVSEDPISFDGSIEFLELFAWSDVADQVEKLSF